MEKKYPLYGLDVGEPRRRSKRAWPGRSTWTPSRSSAETRSSSARTRRRRLLTGIELPDLTHVPVAGDAVSDADGRALGELTSTNRGWFLGKALAMGYLPATLPMGTSVTLTSPDGAAVGGVTTHRPFYDPDGTRVRA